MINTKRLLLAWAVVFVVLFVYDFAVYAVALNSFHAQFPKLLKPMDQLPQLRMILTGALNWALVTVLYALFARGRASSLMTGIVFGVLMGLIASWIPQATFKMLLIEWPFYLHWAAAGFGEYVVAGIVLGLVYRD